MSLCQRDHTPLSGNALKQYNTPFRQYLALKVVQFHIDPSEAIDFSVNRIQEIPSYMYHLPFTTWVESGKSRLMHCKRTVVFASGLELMTFFTSFLVMSLNHSNKGTFKLIGYPIQIIVPQEKDFLVRALP